MSIPSNKDLSSISKGIKRSEEPIISDIGDVVQTNKVKALIPKEIKEHMKDLSAYENYKLTKKFKIRALTKRKNDVWLLKLPMPKKTKIQNTLYKENSIFSEIEPQ